MLEVAIALAHFFRRVCDAMKIFERSNETCRVTHHLLYVTEP
jgi:hypothetical protein